MEWNSDQRELRAALKAWYEPLNQGHVDGDGTDAGGFPWPKWKIIRETGVLRLPFDERWGGLGRDLRTTMYVLEALGYGCRDAGLNFSVTTTLASTGVPVQRFATDELKERYLPRICDGQLIGAHAITEAAGGSDALSMRTVARRDGGHYLLNGVKSLVSNGPVADVFVVYARTHPDRGPLGLTAFLLERGTPGLTVGPPVATMGLRSCPLSELVLTDCAVPAGQVVGQPGAGFLILDHVLKWEVLCSFIVNVGEMQYRLERCVDHARSRRQFGRPIGSFQAIAHKIVDMEIGVRTARTWLYDAARDGADRSSTTDVAIAKLVASEANVASALAAVQIFGGRGYLVEYGLERELRNAVAGTIYSGTSEIQRNRVAAMLGLPAGAGMER